MITEEGQNKKENCTVNAARGDPSKAERTISLFKKASYSRR